ncbi:MAG: sulfite exporter TauE/SafE family protein [Lachnospiraceae bacterium]|nr:sulfite exporter TauE/SafE family protein [Lachnospiraceae bacterium]MCD7765628.1 sulfite exporter TauE/SafE family protein [Lachnospiraceae bacterium]
MYRLLMVCVSAGIAAGLGTGFAGMSATTAIVPMLVTFLGVPWYEAVGIGLASDVLASACSAYVYKKNDNLDIKHGMMMVAAVLLMTILGSYFSQYMPDLEMGRLSVVFTTFLGLRFILFPATKQAELGLFIPEKYRPLLSVICGVVIGFYCGFMGLGGGMMMLFILTTILRYDLKTAVGTSVFVMTFIAFTGAVSHFYFGDVVNYIPALVICVVSTLIAALVSAAISNHLKDKTTNRVTGVVLFGLGLMMLWESFL